MTGYIVHDLSMPGILLVFCEHRTQNTAQKYRKQSGEDNNSCDICFQASYETLYHSYLTSNKAESLSSDSSGPGEATVDRTAEVMQAILQVETSKRACVIM